MSYRAKQIRERAKALKEGVYDGGHIPVAMFAEHLAEQGSLGQAVGEITADMTVAGLVEAYVKHWDGQMELAIWAKDVAEQEQIEAEENSAA